MHSFGGQFYIWSGFLDARAVFRIVVEKVDILIAINFYLHSNITVQMAPLESGAHSTIFVAEDEDFCRWRRKCAVCWKHIQKTFVADDDLQYARHSFSSLTTEDKISVASEKNRAVCARLR